METISRERAMALVSKWHSISVFVRAKENMRQSLGTVEISNTGNIVQARAAYNMPLPEDVMEFVKKLKDEVQRRIRKRGIGA